MNKTLSEDDVKILEGMKPLVDEVGGLLNQLVESKQRFLVDITSINSQLNSTMIKIYKAGRDSKNEQRDKV